MVPFESLSSCFLLSLECLGMSWNCRQLLLLPRDRLSALVRLVHVSSLKHPGWWISRSKKEKENGQKRGKKESKKKKKKKERKKRANVLVELNSWQTPQLHIWLNGRRQQIASIVPLAHKHPFHQIRINLDAPQYWAASHKNQRKIYGEQSNYTYYNTVNTFIIQIRINLDAPKYQAPSHENQRKIYWEQSNCTYRNTNCTYSNSNTLTIKISQEIFSQEDNEILKGNPFFPTYTQNNKCEMISFYFLKINLYSKICFTFLWNRNKKKIVSEVSGSSSQKSTGSRTQQNQ